MTDPNGWPDEARTLVAQAICEARDGDPDWRCYTHLADAALAALEPFVTAERAALRAENERLRKLLTRIEDVATDTPTAADAESALATIYEWVVTALTEPSHD